MKQDIRIKKRELLKKSLRLRELTLENISYDKAQKIRKEQDEAYKQYIFLKRLLNTKDKLKEEK